MAKFVSLKLTDESDFWLVDLERGVVSVMNDPTTAIIYAEGAAPANSSFNGLDIAFVSDLREDAFSGKLDK